MQPPHRLLLCVPAIVAAGVGATANTWPAHPSACADELHLLVPAYFYPAGEGLSDWKRLFDASKSASIVAIVNPDSGPGKRADANYAKLFERARDSKAVLVGYVTLSYGKRPLSAVKGDIDSWLYFYPEVRGIFFDEQPSAAELAPFALECFAYARSKIDSAVLVTNPGVPCASEYLAARDSPVACMFEHEKGLSDYEVPPWAVPKPAERFALLLHGVKEPVAMRRVLSEAVGKHAGYVYVTDATMPMPWSRLPAYWDELIDAAHAGVEPAQSR